MCSVCGISDFTHRENVDISIVCKMGQIMKHRGPDESNSFFDECVAFYHNRLAVMDVVNGHQPMTIEYKGRKYTIVYNGEIYNTPELKAELGYYGIKPSTLCDTEIVLYSYIIFKERCAERLNGIFAFTVYDHHEKQLYSARDRMGVKPFFYSMPDGAFVFASEIKALLQHPKISHDVDRFGIWQLLFLSPVTINGSSVFKDIYELKPAEYMIYNSNGLKKHTYWDLKAEDFCETKAQATEHTRWLLKDAIKRQLVCDVPLCTFLSGGLDSSIITSVAAEACKENGEVISTYSFEYEDNKRNFKKSLFQPQGDDEYAVYLAEYLKTEHTVLIQPTRSVAENLFPAVEYRDFPGQADVDSSLLYYCERVRENHTVALSGECSDEIFGGYPWFYRPEMLYKDFFPWIHSPMTRANLFDEKIARQKEGYEYISQIYKDTVSGVPVIDDDSDDMKTSRIATVLSTRYFMTSLLERKDRMSMAFGLEVRVPFADHRILEYVYNIPWKIKFENNVEKALLRNAMSDYLPEKILHRKKSPYPITHNPLYEEYVTDMLNQRIKNGVLKDLINAHSLNKLMQSDSVTWFGQLMNKPQLIAWLVQLDYWLCKYNVNIV